MRGALSNPFDNYGKPNHYGEPNTDRVSVTNDRAALVMRVVVALVCWFLAVLVAAKGISQWFGSI